MMANLTKLKSGMTLTLTVDWLRVKYKLLSYIHPACWADYKYDPDWDKELWDLLVNGQIKFADDHYTALVGEHEVWVANHPYASGRQTKIIEYNEAGRPQCSRATALFLGHELKAARLMTRVMYTPEERQYFFVRRHLREKDLA